MTTYRYNKEQALAKLGISELNEMQKVAEQTIMEKEEIVLLSPTGSGKTLAYLLPILNLIDPMVDGVQALVVVPARELAIQIEQVLRQMGTGYKVNVLYGGRSGGKDQQALSTPPSILIGTPGRLASHLERGTFDIKGLHYLVLDEFDKSLEIGYDDEMITILDALPFLKKKVLTSATEAEEIPDFVELEKPERINFLSGSQREERFSLEKVIYPAKGSDNVFLDLILTIGSQPSIVFCNFKDSIKGLEELLSREGVPYGCFHGDMEQIDREKALVQFRNGSHQLLLATDLAARGLDIPDLQFVIHYQLPNRESEFTHRNGRTARMMATGKGIVLLADYKDIPDYISSDLPSFELKPKKTYPEQEWETLFIHGGRKDKISKGDLAGLFMKQGKLEKNELGKIELREDHSFIAVAKGKGQRLIQELNNTRLKKTKIRLRTV